MLCVETRENVTQGFEFLLNIDQNNEFFVLFQRNFWKFSQKFPIKLFFVKTRENLTQGFEIILKISKIMHFLCFLIEIFENFLKNFTHNWVFLQTAKI